jgi:hypothetical protein
VFNSQVDQFLFAILGLRARYMALIFGCGWMMEGICVRYVCGKVEGAGWWWEVGEHEDVVLPEDGRPRVE